MTLVQITNYTSPNCTDLPQVNIPCIENLFTVHDFWATCACPEKTELPWKFSLYWIYFLHSGFLNNLRLTWKTEGALNSLYWMCFLLFRFFEQLALALKIFAVLNIFFNLKDFWATLCLPWKTELTWNFHCIKISFIIQDFSFRIFEQLCLVLKNRVCSEIFIAFNVFLHSGFLSNFALALKSRVCPKIFEATPPRPPASYAYGCTCHR